MISKILPKSEFGKNVLTLMSGTALAQAIPLVISPILTRMYSPQDFGIFALFSAIVGFISVIASARYEQAVMLPKYEKYAINIFAFALVLICITSFLSFVVIILFKDTILDLLNSKELGSWLYMIPITVFFIAIFNLLSNYNNRTKHYRDIAQATIIKSIVLSVVQVIAGLFKAGFSGLILGQVFAQIFANLKLLQNIIKDKILLKTISFKSMIIQAKLHNKFPKYNMPHALVNTVSNSLPVYIFTAFFGSTIVGHYSLVFLVVLTPLSILSLSIARVFNQKIVEMHNQRYDTQQFAIEKIKKVVKIMILPYIVFIIFAPEVFQIIFGNQWFESAIFLQILSPYLFLNVLVSIISFIPNLIGKQKKAFIASFVHMIVSFFLLYYFSSIGDIYSSLISLSILNVIILIYNLVWMLKALKDFH